MKMIHIRKNNPKLKYFIICLLLSLFFIVGCTSQVSSSNITSGPGGNQPSHLVMMADGIYSINTTVPVVTGKIMTYSIEKPDYSLEWVSSLAKKLGMYGEIRETPEAFFASHKDEEKFIFTVFRDKKRIAFENRNAGSAGNLSDSEAVNSAQEFLKSSDLLFPDASESGVSYNTGESVLSSGEINRDFKQIVVSYTRKIDELPEWDSRMMITVGSQGRIVGIFLVWPGYKPNREVSIKSPEQAYEEFQTKELDFPGGVSPLKPERVVVTNVTLGYSGNNGNYLQPTYRFSGFGQKEGQTYNFVSVRIPASGEVPE
jgi:hypothetical protein